jgi:hypothetical protein
VPCRPRVGRQAECTGPRRLTPSEQVLWRDVVLARHLRHDRAWRIGFRHNPWLRRSDGADVPPRSEHRPSPGVPKRQLNGQPYARTDRCKMVRMLQVSPLATRWGQRKAKDRLRSKAGRISCIRALPRPCAKPAANQKAAAWYCRCRERLSERCEEGTRCRIFTPRASLPPPCLKSG